MAGRRNVQREERLLGEFLAHDFPDARILTRVRLGPTVIPPGMVDLSPAEVRILRNVNRWIDAVVVTDAATILVEAKVLPSPDVIGQLQLYELLARRDPELEPFLDRPLKKLTVWGFEDPNLAEVARAHGIEVRIFQPEWLLESVRAEFVRTSVPVAPTRTPKVLP